MSFVATLFRIEVSSSVFSISQSIFLVFVISFIAYKATVEGIGVMYTKLKSKPFADGITIVVLASILGIFVNYIFTKELNVSYPSLSEIAGGLAGGIIASKKNNL